MDLMMRDEITENPEYNRLNPDMTRMITNSMGYRIITLKKVEIL